MTSQPAEEISYSAPTGKPFGTNNYFKFGAGVLIPILNLFTKRKWRGAENIPQSGPMIAVSNHISYADVLVFSQFLFKNGRAPRYLGKAEVFRIPIIGKIIAGSGQIPVERESENAHLALHHAVAFLKSGHCVGVYPEGTLTRDPNFWPMRAKTGVARLALISGAPVIPCAQWGAQELLPRYGKLPRLWKRTKISITAGKPVDLTRWAGKGDDPVALVEATAEIMSALTRLLEEIRGELAPAEIFDLNASGLPKTGNYLKDQKNKKSKKSKRRKG